MKTNNNAKVIAISSQKGGVGKTTTTFNLGYARVNEGKKVLLIDFDSQGDLTKSMGIPNPDDIDSSIASLMIREMEADRSEERSCSPCNLDEDLTKEQISQYIFEFEKIAIIPCNIKMAGVEVNLFMPNIIDRDRVLLRILEKIVPDYDYILIDCGRSLGLLLNNALSAYDSVIIPVEASYFSMKGLEKLLKLIKRVSKALRREIQVDGILMTMFDGRTVLSKEILAFLKINIGTDAKIFETVIPKSIKIGESQINTQFIMDYAPTSKVAIVVGL